MRHSVPRPRRPLCQRLHCVSCEHDDRSATPGALQAPGSPIARRRLLRPGKNPRRLSGEGRFSANQPLSKGRLKVDTLSAVQAKRVLLMFFFGSGQVFEDIQSPLHVASNSCNYVPMQNGGNTQFQNNTKHNQTLTVIHQIDPQTVRPMRSRRSVSTRLPCLSRSRPEVGQVQFFPVSSRRGPSNRGGGERK